MSRQIDFDDSFAFTRKIHKAYGSPSCFEPHPESFLALFRTQCGFITVVLMLMYHIFGNCYYMVTVTLNKQFASETGMIEEIADIIARCGFTFIGLVKVLVLAYDRNLLAETLSKMRTSWKKQVELNPTYRDVYEKSLNSVVKLTTYASITNILMVSLFNFLPILEMAIDAYRADQWTRQLPYKISMFCLLAVHLSTQMRLLGRSLECMIRSEKDPEEMPRLSVAEAVQFHEQLLEFKRTMESIFSGTTFLVFAGASILICLQGIIMTTSSGLNAFKFLLFFISILLEIFFMCYYGDEIMQSSAAIGSAVYKCLWYEVEKGGDIKFRKTLIPIILRSQKPVVLMAWLFWPNTINTFGMILRTSWTYFTLLSTIYG